MLAFSQKVNKQLHNNKQTVGKVNKQLTKSKQTTIFDRFLSKQIISCSKTYARGHRSEIYFSLVRLEIASNP